MSQTSSSVDNVSATIHRTRSQRIASLPLRYRDNDNRSLSSTTHSTRCQQNVELSPRIHDDASVSAFTCVCNICQAIDNEKPCRLCSSCENFSHLSCCRPKLTKTRSAGLSIWHCQNYASKGKLPVSQLHRD